MKQKFSTTFWKRALSAGLSLAMAAAMIPSVDAKAAEDAQETELSKAGSIAGTNDTRTKDQPFASFTGGSANFSSPAFTVRQVVKGMVEDEMQKPSTGMTSDLLISAAEAKYGVTRDGGGQDIIASVSSDGGKIWKYSFPFYFPDSVGSGNKDATTVSSPVLVDDEKLNETAGEPGWVIGGTTYCLANVYPGGVADTSVAGFAYPGAGTGYIDVDGTKRLALTDSYEKASLNPTAEEADYNYYVGDFDESTGRAPVMEIAETGSDTASEYQVDRWYNLYKKTAGSDVYNALEQAQIGSDEKVQQNVFYKASDLHVYNTGYIMCVTSEDGAVWSAPEILNPVVYHNEEEIVFLSSGKGLKTTGNRLAVQAYSKTNEDADSKASMIWHCPTAGHTWHRSGDVPAFADAEGSTEPSWMEGAGIVELSKGNLRMFLRSGRGILYYADADRTNPEGSDLTDVFEFSAPVATGTSITPDSRTSAIEYSGEVNEEPAIMVTAPTGAEHTNGHLMGFRRREDSANPTLSRTFDYALQSGNFASASMDEMNYGSNFGILWENGLGRVRFEDYYTLDILGNDYYTSGLEYDVELRPNGDSYTRSYHVAGADNMEPEGQNPAAGNANIADVTFERGEATTEEVITLYSHSGDTNATNLTDAYQAETDDNVNIKNAEFTVKKIKNSLDDVYSVYSAGMQRYLTNVNSIENLFTTTLRNPMKITQVEDTGKFKIGTANVNEMDDTVTVGSYLLFNKKGMTIDRHNGQTGANWDYDFFLLEKMTEGDTAAEGEELVPGYKKVSEITDGKQYLIAHVVEPVEDGSGHTGTGGVVILYPRNTKARHAKLVGEKAEKTIAATKTLTIAPKSTTGKTDVTVNKITYHINVKHETLRVAKGGNVFIEGAQVSGVTLGEASSYVTAEDAEETRKAYYKRTGDANNSLSKYNQLDANVNVEDAEFIITETGEEINVEGVTEKQKLYTIYNEKEEFYLINDNANGANKFYNKNPKKHALVPVVNEDETTSFEMTREDGRYLYFYYVSTRFDGLGTGAKDTIESSTGKKFSDPSVGDFGFEFLKKKADGSVSDADPIPGYERVNKIESGASYLIAEYFTEPGENGKSAILILYPQHELANLSRMYAALPISGVRLTVSKDANQENPVEITVGDKTYELEVEACDHIYPTTTKGYREPGCTEAGATGDVHCSHCQEKLSDSQEIPATGHKYGEFQPDPEHMPSYEGTGTDGKKKAECKKCGDVISETYSALDYAKDVLADNVAQAEEEVDAEDADLYTEDSYGEYTTALAAAKAPAENADLAAIVVLINNLENAKNGLITKALQTKRDNLKTEIEKAIEDASNEDYTEETRNELKEAVKDYIDMTEAELIAAIQDMTEAGITTMIDSLREIQRVTVKEEAYEQAKSALNDLINKEDLKALYEGKNANKEYTDATWSAFEQAYKAALDELDTADEARLIALKSALETAKAKLTKVSKPVETGMKDGQTVTLPDGSAYQIASAKDKTVIITKGVDAKTVNVGPTVVINKETYKVIAIGKGAFAGLKKAKKVNINANIVKIGDQAFEKSKKLKTVSIGADVTGIGKKAFFNCPKLNKVTIKGKGLTRKAIGRQAFKKTAKKVTLKLPKGLKGKNKTQLKTAFKKAGMKVK